MSCTVLIDEVVHCLAQSHSPNSSTTATSFSFPYPPEQSDTYVKATSYFGPCCYPYLATDPTKSLTGTRNDNTWMANANDQQRLHIDLGSAKVITRIYYENYHNSGSQTNQGVQGFTFWGSNTEADFTDLVFANDGTWVQIGGSLQFDIHVSADQADPKYIIVTNAAAYRYYAIKCTTNWGAGYVGMRRIELQSLLQSSFIDIEMSNLISTMNEVSVSGSAVSEIFSLSLTLAQHQVSFSSGTPAHAKGKGISLSIRFGL